MVSCSLWDTGLVQGWEMGQAGKDSTQVQRNVWEGQNLFLINILFTYTSYYSNILLTLMVIEHPRVQAFINTSDEHLPRTMLSSL